MGKFYLPVMAAVLATGMAVAQAPAANNNSGASNQSTSVATQPNNNSNPVNTGETRADDRNAKRGDDLSGARTSGASANDPAAKQNAASSQSNLGNADPNDTRAQTDANGNPVAAQHSTRGDTWLWLIVAIVVLAFVVRYISRGRNPGTVTNIDNRNRRDDDVRRVG